MSADAIERDGGEGGDVRAVYEAFDEQLNRQAIHRTDRNCRRHWTLVGVEVLDLPVECIHRCRWSARRVNGVFAGRSSEGGTGESRTIPSPVLRPVQKIEVRYHQYRRLE